MHKRALLLALLAVRCLAKDDGLARTPPRGFRTWNLFGGAISQQLVLEVAAALVSRERSVDGVPTSLADLGYSDLGLDDGWQRMHSGPGGVGFHTATGAPIVDEGKFPSLGALTAHVHALNLTVGWYTNNCLSADPSGNLSHFLGDVAAFRSYGFDNIKIDSCSGQKDIALWSSLLPNVVIENCHNGPYFPQHSYKPGAPPYCPFHFYRTSVDVEVLYASIFGINLQSTLEFSSKNLSFPGCA
jgi:alpha-galactosidase